MQLDLLGLLDEQALEADVMADVGGADVGAAEGAAAPEAAGPVDGSDGAPGGDAGPDALLQAAGARVRLELFERWRARFADAFPGLSSLQELADAVAAGPPKKRKRTGANRTGLGRWPQSAAAAQDEHPTRHVDLHVYRTAVAAYTKEGQERAASHAAAATGTAGRVPAGAAAAGAGAQGAAAAAPVPRDGAGNGNGAGPGELVVAERDVVVDVAVYAPRRTDMVGVGTVWVYTPWLCVTGLA